MRRLSKAAGDYLGITYWHMRQDANLLFVQPAYEGKVSEELQGLKDEVQPTQAAVHSLCTLSVPMDAEPPLLHLLGDIVRVLNGHELKYSRKNMDVNDPLPPAPAICFVSNGDSVNTDTEGRLLVPAHCFDLSALEWKPQIWAYLQSLFTD